MSINNNLIPGFNVEKEDSLKIQIEKIDRGDNWLIL